MAPGRESASPLHQQNTLGDTDADQTLCLWTRDLGFLPASGKILMLAVSRRVREAQGRRHRAQRGAQVVDPCATGVGGGGRITAPPARPSLSQLGAGSGVGGRTPEEIKPRYSALLYCSPASLLLVTGPCSELGWPLGWAPDLPVPGGAAGLLTLAPPALVWWHHRGVNQGEEVTLIICFTPRLVLGLAFVCLFVCLVEGF